MSIKLNKPPDYPIIKAMYFNTMFVENRTRNQQTQKSKA